MEDESAAALAPEAYPLPAQPAPVHQHMVQPVHKDQNQWENAPVELPKPVEVSRPGGNGSNAPEPRAGVEPSRAAYPSSAFAHAMDTAHTVDPRARGSESPTNSGDSESSEENAIKARAVAAAKARAAKEAEARDALLNPRPSSGGARNAGTAAKKAGAQLQAGGPTGALGSLASQMGGPYQAAMLRLQATISSLQSKVEKDNHLITAGDLETLYNNFDAMMNTHPVFSPAAKRARALAAASAVAEYRRAEMERQQGAAAALQQRGVGTSAGRRGRGTNSQPAHSDRSHLSNWSAGQGRYGATQPQVNWQAQQAQFSQQAEHPGPADAWGSTGGAQYQGAYPPYPSQQQSQHAYPAAPAQPYYDQGGPQDSGLTTFTGAGDAGRASQPGWAGQSATAATAAALSFPGAGGGGGLESELRSSTDLLRMLSSMIARGGEQQLGNRSYESQYAPPPPAPPQTAEEAEIAASALVSLGTTEAKSGRGRGVKRANTEYSLRRQPAPSRRRQEKDDYVEPEYGMVAKQQYQGPGYDYEGRGAHLDQAHPGYGGAPGPAQQPYYAPPQGQAPQGFGRSVEADLLALLAQLSGTA